MRQKRRNSFVVVFSSEVLWDSSVTSKRQFLRQLPLFAALDEYELDEVARISREYKFEPGAVVAYQRDVADSLHIVKNGRLIARAVDKRGDVTETSITHYLPNDFFYEEWLFVEDAYPATVQAPLTEGGSVIIIKKDDFLSLLERMPSILERFEPGYETVLIDGEEVETGLSELGWALARKTRIHADKRSAAISLLPDELVEYQARRSWKYLLLGELGWLFGFIVVPTIAYLLLRAEAQAAVARNGDVGVWNTLTIVVPGVIMLIFLAVMAFRLLDWALDYFVITNKHLAHREFDLVKFQIRINKIPIHQIQNFEIDRPNLIANILGIGTARIKTASAVGQVLFDNIDNPDDVLKVLQRLNQRTRNLDEAREQMNMRQTIEKHFKVDPPYELVKDEDSDLPPPVKVEPSFWQRLRRSFQSRVEGEGKDGIVITYRKHAFVLVKEIVWPVLVALLLVVIAFLLARFSTVGAGQLLLVFGLFLAVDLGWLVWQVEDWRNDTFQVTDKFVIDIDRRPFGFGESRKQAGIDNVQNVNADRPGLMPTLFNYGDVVVETAGANANIVFEDVANPSQVQSDIFRRMDQARVRRRQRESESRRKEYSVLMDVYKQATEQERIPRRTPPAMNAELESN